MSEAGGSHSFRLGCGQSPRWSGQVYSFVPAGHAFQCSMLKKFRVSSSTNKDDGIPVKPVNQKKVAAYMALSMITPIPFQLVVPPFWPKGFIVGNQLKHHAFEELHVISGTAGKPLPVSQKLLGV